MDFLAKYKKYLTSKSLLNFYIEKNELNLSLAEKEGKVFTEDEVLGRIYSKYKKEFDGIPSHGKLVFYRDNSYGKQSGFFKVWMTFRFPILSKILIEQHKKQYNWLKKYSLEQIIQYLPIFLLRDLERYLSNPELRLLIKHLLEGKNVRTFEGLPFPLTKKMAHQFHNMTFGKNLEQVYYRSLVYGLGGSVTLFELMKNFWVPSREGHLERIIKVIPFFKKHPELDAQVLRSLLGYVNHMFQEHENYELKGRTISSLRRASVVYYEEMTRAREERSRFHSKPKPESWEGATYGEWSDHKGYKIIQLKTAVELDAESAKMHHCVRGYTYKCGLGKCSIWSLRYVDENFSEDILVTIEVDQSGCIIQAKAPCNQMPEDEYMKKIRKWMKEQRLKMAAYV